MNKPRVSVVIAAYNSGRTLSAAIESVQRQSEPNWELVIVNDGSADETGAIAETFAMSDSRVRVLHQDNTGAAVARNNAIEQSASDVIAVLDADDVAHSQRLSIQLRELHNRDLGVVGSYCLICDDNGKHIGAWKVPLTHDAIVSQLQFKTAFCHTTTMFRRELFVNAGRYSPYLQTGEDTDMLRRLASKAKVANLPVCLVLATIHPKSLISSKALEAASEGDCTPDDLLRALRWASNFSRDSSDGTCELLKLTRDLPDRLGRFDKAPGAQVLAAGSLVAWRANEWSLAVRNFMLGFRTSPRASFSEVLHALRRRAHKARTRRLRRLFDNDRASH